MAHEQERKGPPSIWDPRPENGLEQFGLGVGLGVALLSPTLAPAFAIVAAAYGLSRLTRVILMRQAKKH